MNHIRKLRSKHFDELVGQPLVVRLVQNSLYRNLIFCLCACFFSSAMYRELIIPHEKSQLISQLQVLSAQVSQQPKIPSLKTLVALWIARYPDLFKESSTVTPLPHDLDALLTRYSKHNHAVQLLQTMHLTTEVQEIHRDVRYLYVGPDRKFLFIDHKWGYSQEWGYQKERACSIYKITERGPQLLGMVPGCFVSITYDNNYACLEQDDKIVVIELPSLHIIAEYDSDEYNAEDAFGDCHYLAFNPVDNTCSLINRVVRMLKYETWIFGYSFDEEECWRLNPEIYIFNNRSEAHQLKHYLACLHNQLHKLTLVPPYRSSLHSLTTTYWNFILGRYLEEHGIEIMNYHPYSPKNYGSITPDGRYCTRAHTKDTFFVLDMQSLESFDMKKNYFKLGKKDAIKPKEIRNIAISPHGTMLLILFSYRPPEMKGRDVRERRSVLCLYDIATRDWCVLTEQISSWPGEGFWFSEDGNFIEVYSGRNYRRYDLCNLCSTRSFSELMPFISPQNQVKDALKHQKALI